MKPTTRQRNLTTVFVESLAKAPPGTRYEVRDTECRGLRIRVTATGHKTWIVRRRVRSLAGGEGQMAVVTLGEYLKPSAEHDPSKGGGIEWARDAARAAILLCKQGQDPTAVRREGERAQLEAKEVAKRLAANSVESAGKRYIDDYVKKHLRRSDEPERIFRKYINPAIGGRVIYSLGKSDLYELGRAIEEAAGPVMADRAVSQLRAMLRWTADTVDDKLDLNLGKQHKRSTDDERSRVLDDAELRAFWVASSKTGLYGKLLRSLLLSATRREELGGAKRSELSSDGRHLLIPASRYKTKKAFAVALPKIVQEIIADLPDLGEYLFSTTGANGFNDWSRCKKQFDAEMLAALREAAPLDERAEVKLAPWTVHDLRRTARTRLSNVGVSSDIAERVLGHAMEGERKTYDMHKYETEKLDAVERLVAHIKSVVEPPPDNVTALPKRSMKSA